VVIDGVSLTHDEATKAVKQVLKNSARLGTEQPEKGAEELRELKTSAALWSLWSEGRVKIAFDRDDEPLKFGAIEPE
jgi:hypothetical protein